MPSAIKLCECAINPATICAAVNKLLTATLTQVERLAMACRLGSSYEISVLASSVMIFSSAASLDYTVIGSKAAILQNALNRFLCNAPLLFMQLKAALS